VIHHLKDLTGGFDDHADVIVVGSGAGGAVAARNFAAAGLRTVVLEAGPQIAPEDMTRDGPGFMSQYMWDGGLRIIQAKSPVPIMQGRCLGGSTVMNSAIMLKIPDWVRQDWSRSNGLHWLEGPELDAAFERIFEGTRTAPTPMSVMGPRNRVVREALAAAGQPGKALPRAVHNCEGCADCLVGCASGAKQSTDRSYIPGAVKDGARVYTCAHVENIEMEGTRAVGVTGRVVDPRGRRSVGTFHVRAPRIVLAAGVMNTPVILQRSGINPRGRIGATLNVHLTGGVIARMEERVDPWIGATQGWGAISEDIRGMKFESLWAPPGLLLAKWGGMGEAFLRELSEIKYMAVIAIVYRGKCSGSVKADRHGRPNMKFQVPDFEARNVFRGMKMAADGFLDVGAQYVSTGTMPGVPSKLRNKRDTEHLLSSKLGAKHMMMTGNHAFGSCRMSASESEGPVDPSGAVRGVEGVYICDTSIFPSPTAVNPQATCMAMADVLTRQIAARA
jgi:choline dehydrogenase-like flavoprotein